MDMLAKYDARNGEALDRLVNEKGVQLRRYSDDILQAAQEAAFELYEERAAESDNFRSVFENWQEFRQKMYNWNQINQLSFATFVYDSGS